MNINNIMENLAQYMRIQEEAAAMVEALKDQVKSYMKEKNIDTITGDEHKASYKAVVSSRIDTTALKRDDPQIAEKYTKRIETKRFIFS